MKKYTFALVLLLAGLLGANYFLNETDTDELITPLEESSVEAELEEEVEEVAMETVEEASDLNGNYSVREVSIGGEAGSEDEAYQNHLLLGETELIELPLSTSFMVHFGVTHVYEGLDQDIVVVTQNSECGGCIAFLDRYYVVDKSDLSVESIEFNPPSEVNIWYNGAVYSNTVFSDETNELAFVNEVGDIYDSQGELNEAYYEDVWSYSFDTQAWQWVLTTKPGHTVKCDNYMGWVPDPNKIHYWKEALVTSPQIIEPDFEKNLCSPGY